MIKIYLYEMKIPEEKKNDFLFIYNGCILEVNDDLTLYEKGIKSNNSVILGVERLKSTNNKIEGRELGVNVEINNETILKLSIGILNTIKDLYNLVEINLSKQNIFIKEMKINEIKYERNDERTLPSIGLRKNFTCKIKARNLNEENNCIIL